MPGLLMEVIHTVQPRTPDTFARYVEAYERFAIAAFRDHGWDVIGWFQFRSGDPGRDLLILEVDSMSDMEQKAARLYGDSRVTVELSNACRDAGVSLGELSTTGMRVAHCAPERTQRVVEHGNADAPRTYCMMRHQASLSARADVYRLLDEAAVDVESTGKAELALCYDRALGQAGLITEIWAMAECRNGLFVPQASVSEHRAELRLAAPEITIDWLHPLPYSPLQ
ncbi:MAG: hypothetical protein ACI89D_000032 [Bermanella sp.]|jgi:hypothetical protein